MIFGMADYESWFLSYPAKSGLVCSVFVIALRKAPDA